MREVNVEATLEETSRGTDARPQETVAVMREVNVEASFDFAQDAETKSRITVTRLKAPAALMREWKEGGNKS